MEYYYEDHDAKSPLGVYVNIEFDVDYDFDPGEKAVMYYSDGSGHPGSPPQADLNSIAVTKVIGENGVIELDLNQKTLMEKWLFDKFSDIPDDLYEKILENESQESYDRDDYYEED